MSGSSITRCVRSRATQRNYLSHARHDPAHCLAPGLFRALKRGERSKCKLDITYTFGEGDSVNFKCCEPLGADDLRILQGIVAMAGVNGYFLSTESETESAQYHRLMLNTGWDIHIDEALVVKGSYRTLAREIGYVGEGGSVFASIRKCIERLWNVSLIVTKDGRRYGFRLLSGYCSNDDIGQLHVALSPIIAHAIMGGGKYIRIDMEEVRKLKGDAARLIHQRLCGWIDPCKTRIVGIEKLSGYVWPEKTNKVDAIKKRHATVRRALREISSLNWVISEYKKGIFRITRPAITRPL